MVMTLQPAIFCTRSKQLLSVVTVAVQSGVLLELHVLNSTAAQCLTIES